MSPRFLLLLPLGLLSLTACTAQTAMPSPSPSLTHPTEQAAYLFRIADGADAAAARAALRSGLRDYPHAEPTVVGRQYLRVTFTQDPGLAALQSAIASQAAISTVQAEQHYGIDPPPRHLP